MVLFATLLFSRGSASNLDLILAPLDPALVAGPVVVEQPAEPAAAPARRESSQPTEKSPRISREEILDQLTRAFTERLQPVGYLRLHPQRDLPDLSRRPAPARLELLDAPSRLTGNAIMLRFRVEDADGEVGEWHLPFRVQHLAAVWVVDRRLATGDPLSEADFTAREVDLLREAHAVPADPAVFHRYEPARPLVPGRPLTWPDLAPRSLVRKGEIVDVVATDGLLTINMKALAIQGGALGDVIPLRNLESRRDFAGEITHEKRVRVTF